VLVALDSGDLGGEVAVMLEEIEMPPSELFEVMGLAHLSTFRAWKPGSPVRGDFDIELMGAFDVSNFWSTFFQGFSRPRPRVRIS
jgi:hypothetical protein